MEDIILNYICDNNEEFKFFLQINYFNNTIYRKDNNEKGTFTIDKDILNIYWTNICITEQFIKNIEKTEYLIFNSIEKIKKVSVFNTICVEEIFLTSKRILLKDNFLKEYIYNPSDKTLTIDNEVYIQNSNDTNFYLVETFSESEEYFIHHKDWQETCIIKDDIIFRKNNSIECGKFIKTDIHLEILWEKWDSEKFVLFNNKYYYIDFIKITDNYIINYFLNKIYDKLTKEYLELDNIYLESEENKEILSDNDLENDLEKNETGNDLDNYLDKNESDKDLENYLDKNESDKDLDNDLENDLDNNESDNDLDNDLDKDLDNDLENNLKSDLKSDLQNNNKILYFFDNNKIHKFILNKTYKNYFLNEYNNEVYYLKNDSSYYIINNNSLMTYNFFTTHKTHDLYISKDIFNNNIFNFDFNIYRDINKDLINYNDNELLFHWLNIGIYENRIYSGKIYSDKICTSTLLQDNIEECNVLYNKNFCKIYLDEKYDSIDEYLEDYIPLSEIDSLNIQKNIFYIINLNNNNDLDEILENIPKTSKIVINLNNYENLPIENICKFLNSIILKSEPMNNLTFLKFINDNILIKKNYRHSNIIYINKPYKNFDNFLINIKYEPCEYQIKIFNNEYPDINKEITFLYNNLKKIFRFVYTIYDICQIIIFFYILSKDVYDILDNNFIINYNILSSLLTYDLSKKYFCCDI